MNELQVFQNAEFGSVRTIVKGGEPWFFAKDISSVLGYSDTQAMTRRLDSDDVDSCTDKSSGQGREVSIINESGLYTAILGSQKLQAKKFKRWVTSEVLPSIRQHGVYGTDDFLKKSIENPEWAIGLLKKLQEKNTQLAVKDQQLAEMKPKVSYYDLILKNKSLVNITQIAKDYGMSGRAFNQLLHEHGVQYKQGQMWLLYQKHAASGYTQSVTQLVNNDQKSVMHTKWTQKGRLFLYDLLKSKSNILPVIERGEENV